MYEVSYHQGEYLGPGNCMAQWGQNVDGIADGNYDVGFLLHTPGDNVEVVLDVAIHEGSVVRSYNTWIHNSEGDTCQSILNVPLAPCAGTEFRVKYKAHGDDPHTLDILSTSVSPAGSLADPCW